MIYFISVVVLLILAAACWKAGQKFREYSKTRNDDEAGGIGIFLQIVAGLCILGLFIQTGYSSIKQVPAGHVGLVYTFNDITGQRPAGIQVIAPWQGFKLADVRIQKIRPETTCGNGIDECLDAFSEETQDVFIVATANISVSASDVQDLYRNVGSDYLSKIVRPRLHQIFKDETVKYRSVDIAPHREAIRVAVRDRLRTELAPFSINVDDLLIDNMDFRPEFKQAIEAKQIATQEALRQLELVAAETAKANQAIAAATGQAEANRLLAGSISPILVQWRAIEMLSDNVTIALIPSGQGIIIDPTNLFGTAP